MRSASTANGVTGTIGRPVRRVAILGSHVVVEMCFARPMLWDPSVRVRIGRRKTAMIRLALALWVPGRIGVAVLATVRASHPGPCALGN